MDDTETTLDMVRAALQPHGLFLRGVVHFDGDGPEMTNSVPAETLVLVGNVGGSAWPAFQVWLTGQGDAVADPLDRWSVEVIRPLAATLGGCAYFPSEKPWQPFQQWAMRAEGLKASPLGVLIHPQFGLWHGYRGAIGFAGRLGTPTSAFEDHPCGDCVGKPCLTHCPVDAVRPASFDVAACRSHIHGPQGEAGCMATGCMARNACPVGAEYRYPPEQLRFHMAALSRA